MRESDARGGRAVNRRARVYDLRMSRALPNTDAEWTAVTLLDGSVLGIGGGACGTPMALPDIDFFAGAIQ